MKRNEVIQFRVTQLEKEEIERRAEADVATYLRSLALGPIWAVSQLLLAEKDRTEPEHWEIEVKALDPTDVPKPHPGDDIGLVKSRLVPAPELAKLVKQLEAQGKSPSEANSLARKRLGL